MNPQTCHHELLLRVDKMKDPPKEMGGVMRPFMVCSDCGAVLYLSVSPGGNVKTHRPWVTTEG
jgi:hypothetical protein